MIWVRHAASSEQTINLLRMLNEIPEGTRLPQHVTDKGRNEPSDR